jgi:hypothetical protein
MGRGRIVKLKEDAEKLIKFLDNGGIESRTVSARVKDVLTRYMEMCEELKQSFNCEGCRGPKPLCHITGELECIRRPYFRGE